MVICWSVSPRLVPARAPAVRSRRGGSPRPARWDRAGLVGRGRGCWRRCLRADVEGPNRSGRTTPTAAMTNNHRIARNASLMRVTVSVFIGSCVLGVAVAVNRCRLCGTPGLSAPELTVCRRSATPAGPAGPSRTGRWLSPGPRRTHPRLPPGARHVAARHLEGGTKDHPGGNPEGARGQVRDALKANPHRPDEGVTLLTGMLAGQRGQFDAKVVGVDLQALEVAVGQFHHEIVWYKGSALRHDRGPVIHLALHRAGNLNRLQLGLERPREGTLHHALEPALEALKNSHPGTSFPYPHPMVSAAGGRSKPS